MEFRIKDKKTAYIINKVDGTEAYYLTDNHGFILNKEEMKDLIRGLQITLSDPESLNEIDISNKEERETQQKELAENNIHSK